MKSDKFYPNLLLRNRVLKLMESEEDYGGPQSVVDLERNLKISNGSSRSVLVKMLQAGMIERMGKGIYRAKNDERVYNPAKPYLE